MVAWRPEAGAYPCALLLVGLACMLFYGAFLYGLYGGGLTGLLDQSGHAVGRDFVNYWTAGVLVEAGRVGEIFDLQRFHAAQESLLGQPFQFHMWSYPPTALLFVAPLGYLPYLWGLAAWSLGGLAVYLAVSSRFGLGRLELAALALAPASVMNLLAGQNGFLTAALLLGGLALLERRPALAGVLIGLLSVKPQLGVLLPLVLIADRNWRAFGAATLTTCALFATSVAIFGWDAWRSYLEVNASAQSAMLHRAQGAFVYLMPSAFMAGRILGLGVAASYAVQALLALVAAAGVYWLFRGARDRALQVAGFAAGTVLALPYLHNYDLTLLGPGLLWLARRGYRDGFGRGEQPVLLAAWLLPILVMVLNYAGLPLGPVIALALFLIVLARWRDGPAA